MLGEIKEDIKRAKDALESAERNFKENDVLTAANRNFVACENAVYVLLKSKFGSTSISRMKILTRLKEINPKAKETYDRSYDLRAPSRLWKRSKSTPIKQRKYGKDIKRCKRNCRKSN